MTSEFKMVTHPICGWQWLQEHRLDHTHAEVEALGIVIQIDGFRTPVINETRRKDNKGIIKDLMR